LRTKKIKKGSLQREKFDNQYLLPNKKSPLHYPFLLCRPPFIKDQENPSIFISRKAGRLGFTSSIFVHALFSVFFYVGRTNFFLISLDFHASFSFVSFFLLLYLSFICLVWLGIA